MRKIVVMACAAVLLSSCGGAKYAITSVGENLSSLTKVTDNEEPCETPFGGDNGRNLFFAVRENGSYFNIYKKDNPFSSAMNQKTSGKNRIFSPAYSEVTDKIAFRCQLEGQSTSDIYMMSGTQGKALTQVTESSDAFEGHPSFNPDGTIIAYDKVPKTYSSSYYGITSYYIASIQSSEIWLKNLKTGESVLLGNGYQPSFSPDGKKIVFVKYSSDARSCSIWIMDIDGSNPSQITDAKKGYAFNPRFSPNGKKIVFNTVKKDKKDSDIYIIDVDGNNLMQLTINKSYDGEPYWTKDGYIYFVSDRGNKAGNYQIWRFKYLE